MKIQTLAAVAALALTAAGPTLAQPAPPRGDAPAQRMHRPDPAAMAERRAQHLRDVLQLRPDQEAALRAYVDAHRRPADARQRMRAERGQPQQLTTPQRIERQRARMAERQARFDQRAQATLRFYAALNPVQQRAFDALHKGRGHGGKMRRGGPGGHRGHG